MYRGLEPEDPVASRPGTITIKKPADAAPQGEEPAESGKRPRNLPPADVAAVGFSLVVDGKAKSHYDSAKAASEAGLALKRAFPVVQVAVYDAAEKTRSLIELPDGATQKD